MNEYLYEIMDDKTEHDEMDEYVAASRKVAKKYRTYFDIQICLQKDE